MSRNNVCSVVLVLTTMLPAVGFGSGGDESNTGAAVTAMACVLEYELEGEGLPIYIAPASGSDCTMPTIITILLKLTNAGDETTEFTVTSSVNEVSPVPSSGTLAPAETIDIQVDIGEYAIEGVHSAEIEISACDDAYTATIPLEIIVVCKYFPPEHSLLSTFCWSIAVWNVPRAGLSDIDEIGNMFWFANETPVMYDQSLIVSYKNHPDKTYFSIYGGSEDGVSLVATDSVITESYPFYEYAHGAWATPDTSVEGEVEYYLPAHPDTCVLIERVTVCNPTDTGISVHVGEAIDWNIPDDSATWVNESFANSLREAVYQKGLAGSANENVYGTASLCDLSPGAIVLENDTWVEPNSGYVPTDIGTLIANHAGFVASDSIEDLNSVYVVFQDLDLAPGECTVFCMVKASSLTGLEDLQELIDRGRNWIGPPEFNCPGCSYPDCVPGDVDGGGAVDIDDIVYFIGLLCDSMPGPLSECADCDGDCDIDALDFAYLVDYLILSGPLPLPLTCREPVWKIDPDEPDTIEIVSEGLSVDAIVPFVVPINMFHDEELSGVYFDRIFVDYEAGGYLLKCDSVSYSGTRLEDNAALSARSFSHSDFLSESGGYITLTLEAFDDQDYLSPGQGPVANIWFTPLQGGRAQFTLTHESHILTMPLSFVGDYTCIEPQELLGDIVIDVPYLCGDANSSGGVDIDDVVYLITYIFAGGSPPSPYEAGDADCSGVVDIDDAVYVITYVFSGGPAPCDPDGNGEADC